MEELLATYQTLPPFLKVVVAMGVFVPLLVVWAYLNPPKPPPKKPDGTAKIEGNEAKIYMNPQTFVEKKEK
ncbi:MAG: hypothetical protein KDD73_16075 [Anaerolineales bacterium]|nr:hypothetical protein [Anaerolineales bacterium]MCB9128256.1 hypothetical protein [Ardenticatenales bacterium]